jgi:hypothetical protein
MGQIANHLGHGLASEDLVALVGMVRSQHRLLYELGPKLRKLIAHPHLLVWVTNEQ